MPRGSVTKGDIKVQISKIKTELYDGTYHDRSADWHDGAHEMLNKVLDYLQEWRE